MAEYKVHTENLQLITEGGVKGDKGHDVTLHCHLFPETNAVAMTIRWFKETECVYLYKNGQEIEGRGYEDRLSLSTRELERGNLSLTLRGYRGVSDRGVYIAQVIHGEQQDEAAVWLSYGKFEYAKRFGDSEEYLKLEAERFLKEETMEEKQSRVESAHLLEIKMVEREKNRQLEEMKETLRESESRIKEKNSSLEEMNNQLQDKERRLKKTIQEANETIRVLQDKETQLTQQVKQNEVRLQNTVKEMEEGKRELDEMTQQNREKDRQLDEMTRQNREKDRQLDEMTRQNREDRQLDEMTQENREKDRQLDEITQQNREKDKQLDEMAQQNREKDRQLDEMIQQNREKDRQLDDITRQVEQNETRLQNKELEENKRQLETLRKDLQDQNYQVENLTVQLRGRESELQERNQRLVERDKQLEEKDKLLEERSRQLEGKDELMERKKDLEENDQQVEERKKLLEERDKQLERKDEELMEKKKEWQDVNTENAQLAQQICGLKTELERLKIELQAQKTASGETTLPLRRRNSTELFRPTMSGETPDADSTLPRRRTNSGELYLPELGGESSRPDSPVSPSVSELRLVLLGRTGDGGSAAANTILGREEFGAQAIPPVLAQRSRRREGEVCGRRLVLVDTPDCPGLSLEEMRQDVGRCVRLSAPGPQAFLLVVPVEPSEGEERGMMERMEEMFGEGCWGHTVILFTHSDGLKEQSMEEFLQAGSQDLQQLVEKCGNRYHVLNVKDRSCGPQVSELLEKIEEMVSGNTESFYSTQTYQEAEAQVREMERIMLREIKERKDREGRDLKEKLEKELKEKDAAVSQLKEDIKTHNEQISALKKQVDEERDDKKREELEKKLETDIGRREEMERELERVQTISEKERRALEERHRHEMGEIEGRFEEEVRAETERNLMRIVLPALQKHLDVFMSERERQFSGKIDLRDREIERLRRKLIELSEDFLEEVYLTGKGKKD